jgi:hypothetical protein
MDDNRSLQSMTGNRGAAGWLRGFLVAVTLVTCLFAALAGSAGALTELATVVPANTAPPTISGTPQEGQTLTADKGTWTGTEPITYTFVWQRCDAQGAHCGNIKDATSSTYKLVKADVGKTLRVVATAKNAEGTGSATSAATAVVTAAPVAGVPANTALPTISGTAQEGQTLTASSGSWSGNQPITYAYVWQRCDSSGGHCADIGGAKQTTYVLTKADVDKTIRVVVTAKNAAGSSSATSAPTAVVKAAVTVTQSVTLASSASFVVYGNGVTLSGTVSPKQAGDSVTILAQPFGDAAKKPVATVTTGTDGTWSYRAKPKIQTTYQAQVKAATSSTVTIGVKPLVTFHVITGGRFSTRAVAGRSFAGRLVQVQRRSSAGRWVTLKRVRLNSSSAATFRVTSPKGTSTLRVAMSVNQAGAGYLGGISRTIVFHRA